MYKNYSDLGNQNENIQQQENTDSVRVLDFKNGQERDSHVANNSIVCVYVYADWCGPCKKIAPDYAQLAGKYGQNRLVKFKYENMPKNEQNNIGTIPFFIFYVNGVAKGNIVGGDLKELEGKIQELLGASQANTSGSNQQTRNSIRNNRLELPRMDPIESRPFRSEAGSYSNFNQ
jgi:thioredoxin 1